MAKVSQAKSLVSDLLRAKVVRTIVYLLKTYPFSSASNQQCIHILTALKSQLSESDLKVLRKFISVELEGSARFQFPSGYGTNGLALGQIT